MHVPMFPAGSRKEYVTCVVPFSKTSPVCLDCARISTGLDSSTMTGSVKSTGVDVTEGGISTVVLTHVACGGSLSSTIRQC